MFPIEWFDVGKYVFCIYRFIIIIFDFLLDILFLSGFLGVFLCFFVFRSVILLFRCFSVSSISSGNFMVFRFYIFKRMVKKIT